MSGDGILKIDCTYCEEDKGSISIGPIRSIPQPPQAPTKTYCPDNKCPIPKTSRR